MNEENQRPPEVTAEQVGDQLASNGGEVAQPPVAPVDISNDVQVQIGPEEYDQSKHQPNLEMDEARAETMAHASDQFRTKAAETRIAVSDKAAAETSFEESNQKIDDLKFTPRSKNPIRRNRQRAEVRDAYEERYDHLDDIHAAEGKLREQAFLARDDFDGIYGKEYDWELGRPYSPSFDDDRHKGYDDIAERIEEWAGILHDHPIGPEYLEAHPDIDFSPKGLLQLEIRAKSLERTITKDIAPEAEGSSYTINLIESRTISELFRSDQARDINNLLRTGTEQEVEQWSEITQEIKDALSKIPAFHSSLVKDYRLGPAKAQLSLLKSVLDYVRAGKASKEHAEADQQPATQEDSDSNQQQEAPQT